MVVAVIGSCAARIAISDAFCSQPSEPRRLGIARFGLLSLVNLQPHFERVRHRASHIGYERSVRRGLVLKRLTENTCIRPPLRILFATFGPRHGVPKTPAPSHVQFRANQRDRLMTVDMPCSRLDPASLRRLFEVGMARMISEPTRGLKRDTRASGRRGCSVLATFKKPTQSRQTKLRWWHVDKHRCSLGCGGKSLEQCCQQHLSMLASLACWCVRAGGNDGPATNERESDLTCCRL